MKKSVIKIICDCILMKISHVRKGNAQMGDMLMQLYKVWINVFIY